MGLFTRTKAAALAPGAVPAAPPNSQYDRKYDLALAEARRSFDEQATQLGRVRSAMTGLLASGGIAFSVLVIAPGQIAGPHARPLLLAAAVTFGLLAIGVVAGTAPVKITPGVRAIDLIRWADEGDTTETSTRNLAHHYDDAYAANKKKIDRLVYIHMACLALFGATILILTVRLMGA